jgi:hypothetical protein
MFSVAFLHWHSWAKLIRCPLRLHAVKNVMYSTAVEISNFYRSEETTSGILDFNTQPAQTTNVYCKPCEGFLLLKKCPFCTWIGVEKLHIPQCFSFLCRPGLWPINSSEVTQTLPTTAHWIYLKFSRSMNSAVSWPMSRLLLQELQHPAECPIQAPLPVYIYVHT